MAFPSYFQDGNRGLDWRKDVKELRPFPPLHAGAGSNQDLTLFLDTSLEQMSKMGFEPRVIKRIKFIFSSVNKIFDLAESAAMDTGL